jgi:hypothetical protein
MGCPTGSKYIGRVATLEIAFQCADADPAGATFLPIGAVTTKGFELSANETSVYADDSGGFDENLIVNSSFSISCEGYSRSGDATDSNQTALMLYYFNSLVTNTQPVVLVRYTWPDLTLLAYMNVNAFNRSDPVDDKSSFTSGFSKAPSPAYQPTLTATV